MNVTPEKIFSLKPNEIFVFGSNLDGCHAGGAAYFAVKNFGAKMGQAVGLQGQSYAIPTLSHAGGLVEHMLPLSTIQKYVNEMISVAKKHPELFFYVTPIGCGIAGFTPEEIAPMFKPALNMDNIALPQSFIDVIGAEKRGLGKIIDKIKSKLPISESELRTIVRESVKLSITENIGSDEALDRILN